jgi:Na+-driven multidrug efflux pump
VIVTEIVWSLGTTFYNAIYAHISTESIAAYNVAVTLDRLVFVVFFGLAHACAIMIGNQIGAGDTETASIFGKKYLLIGVICAVASGLLIFLVKNPILALYRVTPLTLEFANRILLVMILSLPIRSMNLIMLIGILRSGGDTIYAMLIDAGITWVVGVPIALLGAFIFKLPVYWVYTLVMAEEITKLLLGLRRFFKGRWVHALTVPV